MNNRVWNRKEKEPTYTIETLTEILKDIGIEINIVDENNCDNQIYSVSLEVKQLPGIYANGKGISYEYALASGLAEFVERLQTGQLIHNLYNYKEEINKSNLEYKLDECVNFYQNNLTFVFKSKDYDAINEVIQKYPEMTIMKTYFCITKNKKQKMPDSLIQYLCGSNGTCAGNTKEEALTQGLCEVLERYVLKSIYYDVHTAEDFPVIDSCIFKNTNSFVILKHLEEKGYQYVVRDLTFNGKFPVLGLILYNKSKSKYAFAIGSDIDFDLCLQRCITEMFQGKSIDFRFRNSMKTVLDDNWFSDKFWKPKNLDLEYVNRLKDGSGGIPPYLFIETNKKSKDLKPFVNDCFSNKERFRIVLNIFKDNDWDVYLRDCSYLGFPTYRIYVSGVTDVFYYNREQFFELLDVSKCIKSNIYLCNLDEDETKEKLYIALKKLYNLPRYSGYFNFSRYIGLILDDVELCSNLVQYRKLLYLLSILYEEYDDAVSFTNPFSQNSNETSIVNNADRLFALLGRHKKDGNFSKFINSIDTSNKINKRIDDLKHLDWNSLNLPACPCCDECKLEEHCHYKEWKYIIEKLMTKENEFYNNSVIYDDLM